MPTVYLAGPINGCTDEEANRWRSEAKRLLPECTIIDPMSRDYRGKEDDNVAAIVEGDKQDIASSDAVIAMAVRPSFGTAMEIHYADENLNVPVYAVVSDPVSPWLKYHARVFTNLHLACNELRKDFEL